MPFERMETMISGVTLLALQRREDDRGNFLKLFQQSELDLLGQFQVREIYITTSQKGVVRGMHFQLPPHEHVKLVTCLSGTVRDAVVDLRIGSPSFGRAETFDLSGEAPHLLCIPVGFAHGFQALTDGATMGYIQSSEYAPTHDAGVLWSSVGVDWPLSEPILSERDESFPPLAEFKSPFGWSG